MSSGRIIRARLLAWSLAAMAGALGGVTVVSVWGNLWIAWSDKTVSTFHGQGAIRWGFSNPQVQNLGPGMHARWFAADWQWFRPLVDHRAFEAVNLPLWLITLALLIGWLLAARRARRLRFAGRCRTCGYDLAGLASATRCPECGQAFAT